MAVRKVCIDPGHGMSNRSHGVYDPGATDRDGGIEYQEADIALKYGLSLKDVFRAKQVEVFMTRDDSTDHAPVGQRASNAKNAECDVFISLHLNAAEVDQANGLEVLYRDNADASLAQKLQTALIGATGLRDRGVKQRTDLAVLKFEGPAALVELGFISNNPDRTKLLNPQVREAVCKAIFEVVMS